MDTVKLNRFVELEKQRRDLETRLKALKEETTKLKESILSDFEEAGMSKTVVEGMTVYVHRQLWASAIDSDYERACQALKSAGLNDYVQERFNINSLSAYVRELDKAGDPLPSEFDGCIDVKERFEIRTRIS